MPNHEPSEITRLLESARTGDTSASQSLWALVYDELRTLAGGQLRGERAGHTLQPTALANEAYLRLVGRARLSWDSRAHFFGAAARAMRQVLVDHARARGRAKRGRQRIPLDLWAAQAGAAPVDILALDEALERLRAFDSRKAQVVELCFFGGLNVREIAAVLGVSVGTVSGDWRIARMWLRRELTRGNTRDT